MPRLTSGPFLLAVACLVVACGQPMFQSPSPTAGPVATISPSATATRSLLDQLETIALQVDDLGSLGHTFVAFDEGPTQLSDALPAPQSATDRFGRLGGWKARFRQSPDVTIGILVVDSRIDLFPDEGAAASDFAAYSTRYAQEATAQGSVASTPSIGDSATLLAVTPADSTQVRSATIAWRSGPFTGQVMVNGLGEVDPTAAAEMLASVIDQRMTAAFAGD